MKESYKKLKKRGIKLRFITEITESNINHAKKLQQIVDLKHLDHVKGNFAVTESHYAGSANTHEGKEGPFVTQFIVSNAMAFVEQQQYFFDMLWEKAIPADERIKEIEEGIKPDVLETIKDPIEIKKRYTKLIKSAKEEIMLIIPTINEFHRQRDIDIFDLFEKDISKREPSTATTDFNNKYHQNSIIKYKRIRILLPFNDCIKKNIETDFNILNLNKVYFREIETALETKSTVLIIDKEQSFVIEVNNDGANSYDKSIGFATYSNSRATVLSYVSIFESFWKQSDLVKKLKESEDLQKDFVHIAAHELKNPIQPILGLSNLLMKHKPTTDENEFYNIVKIINRNAKKLIQLSNDILDVTKIETNNLNLHKELFNLGDLISDIVEDYNNQLENENVELKCEFLYCNKNDNDHDDGEKERADKKETKIIWILADKNRINQVVSNLLNNAIKFTNKGTIKILIEKKYTEKKVFINIKDSGRGIDQTIIPKLFSKFTTKSKGGTGLGLFISKNVIEGHGGQIWAKNNTDGKGATFGFSLPFVDQ
jgi:two-component system, OmpR family, sensor histidine kinase VicK